MYLNIELLLITVYLPMKDLKMKATLISITAKRSGAVFKPVPDLLS